MSSQESTLRAGVAPHSLWRFAARVLRGEQPLFAMFRSLGTQGLILIINVATGVITARLLGPEGRGVYAAVTLWPPLLSTLAVAGLSSAVVFQMRRSAGNAGGIAAAALSLAAAHSLVAIAAGALFLPLLMTRYSPVTVLFAQLCLINVLVNSVQATVKQAFAGVGEYRYCNLTHLLPQLLHLIALLLIISFFHLTATSAVLALLISGAVAVAVLIPKLVRVVRPALSGARVEYQRLRSYWARAVPTDVVFALAAYSDRLALIPLLPASELGFYVVAFNLSRLIQFVQPALMSVFFSHLSAQSDASGKRLHDFALRFLFICLVPACLFLWMAGRWLLVFAYGADFGEANTVFRLLVIEASLGALSQVNVQLFQSRDRPGVVSVIQLIVLCASVAALLILVPRYGGIGAAVSLLGAGALRLLLLLGAMRGILKLPLPRIYPTRDDLRYVMERLR